ncbi:MAG: CmcI family methyltransferase [Patescibacteria group bacterium]
MFKFLSLLKNKQRFRTKEIIDEFHKLYYNSRIWTETYWLGVPIHKCPFDLWICQEIICRLEPDVVVETGTGDGGSALFFASTIFELMGKGKVLTIDNKKESNLPRHVRIKYLVGSSISPKTVQKIKRLIGKRDRVMVSLDSNHEMEYVLKELRIYSKLVSDGNYLVVEDTNLNGHPVVPDFGPGPMEAAKEFLKENEDFVVEGELEKFFSSFNAGGILRKIEQGK